MIAVWQYEEDIMQSISLFTEIEGRWNGAMKTEIKPITN